MTDWQRFSLARARQSLVRSLARSRQPQARTGGPPDTVAARAVRAKFREVGEWPDSGGGVWGRQSGEIGGVECTVGTTGVCHGAPEWGDAMDALGDVAASLGHGNDSGGVD